MSLIIATGSNLGSPLDNLKQALDILSGQFELRAASRVYKSHAVDYELQPDFFNQALEFALPGKTPDEVMTYLLQLELQLGRVRDISRGPRTIDLDIIFWANETHHTKILTVPHPRWHERSFVVRPLQELPFFKSIEKCFIIPESFKVDAYPV